MTEEYSLADLVEITGAKPRTLQVWAERGVIQPIKSTAHAGTGVHRLFSRKEAIVACIIHPFASHQIGIGELHLISGVLRSHLLIQAFFGAVEKAIGSDGDTLLTVYSQHRESGRPSYRMSVRGAAVVREMEGELFGGYSGGSPAIDLPKLRVPGVVIITIRLETYLAKLK
jgi:hypothetical protein